MNIKRILCPIDFSEHNQFANELASELAASSNASIVYLTVPEQDSDSDYALAMNRIADEAMEKLEAYRPTKPGVDFSHEVKISSLTAQTIVEFAEASEIDMIVLATHGRTGLRRIVMGSVAAAVVRKASCPVLTIKPDFRKPESGKPAARKSNAETISTKS